MENAVTEGNLPFLNEEGVSDDMNAAPVETPEPAPAPEEPKGETAAPPAASEDATRHIPISALLDEREKRQQFAKEAEELRRQLDELRRAQAPAKKADFFDDPESALAQVQQTAHRVAINTKLETSRFLAERDHGADVVAEAYAFFDANPKLSQDLLASPSPFHEAVKVYKKHKTLQAFGDDPDAYIEAQVKARLEAMQAAQPKPTAPPPSLASAPGVSGGREPPASGFAALFGDK